MHIKDFISKIVVHGMLLFCSLLFVSWISEMAFDNTCVELQEQYIKVESEVMIEEIETSINFGKNIRSYYGIEEILESMCEIAPDNLEVAMLDAEGTPLYMSYEGNELETEYTARLLQDSFQQELRENREDGVMLELGDKKTMVFSLYEKEAFAAQVVLIYDTEKLLSAAESSEVNVMWSVMAVSFILLIIIEILINKLPVGKKGEKLSVIIIMAGMLVTILFLYRNYEKRYEELFYENANKAADFMENQITEIVEKGLPIERINDVDQYLSEKVEDNKVIWSMKIDETLYDSSVILEREDIAHITRELERVEGMSLELYVNQQYINEQMNIMALTFLVIFIICFMVSFELIHLADIIQARLASTFNQSSPEQMDAITKQIKLISFITYTAIYISMPYTAVVMRGWKASVFGMPVSVSASIPLTIELSCVMLCSFFIPKLFRKVSLEKYTPFVYLIIASANVLSFYAQSPYILILVRAYCGVGFALLKYCLNSLVAAASEDQESVGINFAKLNAGLLGGITVGASVGGVLSSSFGYRYNYIFTSIIILVMLFGVMALLPWKYLDRRQQDTGEEQEERKASFIKICLKPDVLIAMLLFNIPLNIGLMYVVAFLPTYMDSMGHSGLALSYAYLVNGLVGVYGGVFMMSLLRFLKGKWRVVLAMGMAAAGILVLTVHSSVGIALLSAGIMGLFDGYGTPSVTNYFTSLKGVQECDMTSRLTLFNTVGSGVQIICPLLYNLVIQPDGQTLYLTILGGAYMLVVVLIVLLFREKADSPAV